jgi:short-subunit dehydrogenase
MRLPNRKILFFAAAATMAAAGAGVRVASSSRRIWRSFRYTDLAGKVVLITGGTRGLGLAMAEEFARQGAQLVLCARDESEMRRAASRLERWGTRVLTLRCDVTSETEVRNIVQRTIEEMGGIDILVNNAGQIAVGPFETQKLEDFQNAMDVMFWAHVYTVLAVVPHMIERGSGSVVNITSVGGKVAVPHLLPYGCAKLAAVGLSEGLTSELERHGIHVTTVVPGLMRTGSHLNASFKGDHRAEFSWFSLGATLPLISISARRAARSIVKAVRVGSPEITLGIPAKAAVAFHGLFPGTTAKLFGLANRALPGTGSANSEIRRGAEIDSPLKDSVFTMLGRKAAKRFNQEARSGRRVA